MGAGIMFLSGEKTLILKRTETSSDQWGGTWDFPGGKTDMGETPYETALREAYEEVGPGASFHVVDEIVTRGYTLFIAEVDVEFTPTLDDEHTDWKWINLSDIGEYSLHPKDKIALKGYRRAK